jgi:hypothetical protein
VIDRDLRAEYIGALENADLGNLAILASLFARLERAAIMQALSVDADRETSHQKSLTSAVIESLVQGLERRRKEKHTELRTVNNVAIHLRIQARQKLEQDLNRLGAAVSDIAGPQINISFGGPDYGNAHWYKFEVVKTANDSGKFANFSENHYFVKAALRVAHERLVFVVSFHHVGRDLSGIMEATCFARLESYEDPDEREYASLDFFVCSLEPFVFSYKTNIQEIGDAFMRWLDAALAVAIKEYGDRL